MDQHQGTPLCKKTESKASFNVLELISFGLGFANTHRRIAARHLPCWCSTDVDCECFLGSICVAVVLCVFRHVVND